MTEEQRLRLARAILQLAARHEAQAPDLAPEGEPRAQGRTVRQPRPKTPVQPKRSRAKAAEQPQEPLDPIVEAEARRRLREAFEQAQG